MSQDASHSNKYLKVSVIIPTYNSAECIVRAVESVQAQDEENLEIILVDDKSTDDTVSVVKSLMAADDRIQLIEQEVNGGPSAARNRGFAAAQGEWIAVLDADDAYKPQRLSTIIAAAEANAFDMVADNIVFYDHAADQEVKPGSINYTRNPSVLDMSMYLRSCLFRRPLSETLREPIMQFALLKFVFRREFIIAARLAYPEHYRDNEDFFFYAECLMAGAAAGLIPLPLYIYTQRTGDVSKQQSRFTRTFRDRRQVLQAADELLEKYKQKLTPLHRRLLMRRKSQALGTQAIEIFRMRMHERRVMAAAWVLVQAPGSWAMMAQAVARRLMAPGKQTQA